MLGFQDAAILVAVGFLLFGAQRVPETIKAVTQSAIEFKKGLEGREDPPPPPTAG